MERTLTSPNEARPLAELADEISSWPLADRLRLVRQLAEQVEVLHGSGKTHRDIDFDTVIVDSRSTVQLADPPPRRRFGGDHSSPRFCPPELSLADAVELPADADIAGRLLEKAGYPVDPSRIDVYQLGALLCALLTGEPVQRYMVSPKTKNSVPVAVRSLLARAVGFDIEDRFVQCSDLIAALDEAIRRLDAPATGPEDDTRKWAEGRTGDEDTAIQRDESAGRAPSSEGEPLPFKRLGHFEILSEIGRGGMGDVYKGYDEELQRTVAVKVLPAELARDAEFVKRLHAEARAVAKLDHENLVSVHFSGEAAGHHFFAMQYIQGESLAQRLGRCERLTVDAALDVIEQTLAGLDAAHAEGLIHRDVKPGNILIENGTQRVVLVDFGLVRTVGEGSRITAAGTVLGTVDYISPEQARGATVDCRADLYSVGVLLYRLLAGHLPFAADTPQAAIYRHVHETAPPLCEVAPDVPAEIEAIVARLLEKDPADRYQTAAEVLDAIRACRHAQTVDLPATQVEAANVPQTRTRRFRPVRAAAIVAGLLAVAVLIAVAVPGQWLNRSGNTDGRSETETVSAANPESSGLAQLREGEAPAEPHSGSISGSSGASPSRQTTPIISQDHFDLKPGDALPRGQWVDALRHVDLSWHTVSGDWRREGDELITEPEPMSRIMLPFEIDGSYEIMADFTRTEGEDAISLMLPVGRRSCQVVLSGWGGTAHGLRLIDGVDAYDFDNPATFRPGRLVNDRRYRMLVSVETKNENANIKLSLDGKVVIAWSGRQDSLSLPPQWTVPYAERPGVGTCDSQVTFHQVSLRSVSGKSQLATRLAPPFRDDPDDRWMDLLADVDPQRDAIHGWWVRSEKAIAVAPASAEEGLVRLMLPEEVEGSYDMVAEFTRTKGNESVTINLPVAKRACTLHFSSFLGGVAGLEQIDGKDIGDRHNPAVRRPGSLVNGVRYTALVSVRVMPCPLVDDHDVLIDVWLDGRPFVRWWGRESSLDVAKWEFPQLRHVGLGSNHGLVTFHTLRLRKNADR